MSINILYLIAIALMILGAFSLDLKYGDPARTINLWELGWAFVIIAVAFGRYAVHL